LGSARTHQVDVRLVAATNRNLMEMANRGREDIPALVAHFVEICGRRTSRRIEHIPPTMMSALTSYHWPGNIRELENLIERAVILSDDGVLPDPFPAVGPLATVTSPDGTTLKHSERNLILRTLESAGWVIGGPKGTAEKLGLKRTTLIHKMQKLKISRSGGPCSPNTLRVPQKQGSLSQLQ
jgi:formate hydrogenlyase transcriptional activator